VFKLCSSCVRSSWWRSLMDVWTSSADMHMS
jgi:hypothetical protein